MALPKINETLNFSMVIPSTGKKVKYRPYLVKEEKVLLQAFESGDTVSALEAMVDTLSACIDPKSKLDVSSLTTFDVEYMFLQVRSKSVGETSTILLSCKSCDHQNKMTINIDEIDVNIGENDNMIDITDDISVEMRYPTYKTLMNEDVVREDGGDTDTALALLAGSIAAVLTEEERIDTADQDQEEVIEFLTSMTAGQLEKISNFLQNMPALEHDVSFNCLECKEHNDLKLKGLADFF